MESKLYTYFINLDERGDFLADVRDASGKTIMEIKGHDFFNDGWMRHGKDLKGLWSYLVHVGLISENDHLEKGN